MEATLMKALGVISTTALFLLLGVTIPAFAQEEHHDQEAAKPAGHEQEAKPAQHEETKPAQQKEEAKPAKQEEQAKPAKEEEQAKAKPERQETQAKPVKREEEAKPAKQQEQAKPEKQETQTKQVKQEEHGKTEGQQHAQRSAAEVQKQRSAPALRLSARGSGRIPEDRFRANFGEGHTFVINQPVLVGGFSRFQYGGFWFGFNNPWPAGWYYTDQVYVNYVDGGYYLYNPGYPGARVAISVVI
jgi:primosomal protein N'